MAHILIIPHENGRLDLLERFSNSRALNDSKESGFFLRKKPLSSRAFGVQQLENRYTPQTWSTR